MLATLIGIVAAGCVGVAIVDGPSKRRSVFMAAAIILAGVLLAADQWGCDPGRRASWLARAPWPPSSSSVAPRSPPQPG